MCKERVCPRPHAARPWLGRAAQQAQRGGAWLRAAVRRCCRKGAWPEARKRGSLGIVGQMATRDEVPAGTRGGKRAPVCERHIVTSSRMPPNSQPPAPLPTHTAAHALEARRWRLRVDLVRAWQVIQCGLANFDAHRRRSGGAVAGRGKLGISTQVALYAPMPAVGVEGTRGQAHEEGVRSSRRRSPWHIPAACPTESGRRRRRAQHRPKLPGTQSPARGASHRLQAWLRRVCQKCLRS